MGLISSFDILGPLSVMVELSGDNGLLTRTNVDVPHDLSTTVPQFVERVDLGGEGPSELVGEIAIGA